MSKNTLYSGNGGPPSGRGKLFGLSLVEVMTLQKKTHPNKSIPLFMLEGFKYIIKHGLGIEGIFRIAGTKDKVKQLQMQLDKGEEIDFVQTKVDPVDLADLMKIYFRELPDCLLQSEQYDHFIGILALDRLAQIQKLRELVGNLKPENKEVLHELVSFLGKVAINSNLNKMTCENLGLVWGPNLLWKGGKAVSTVDMMELMAGAGKIKLIVTLLIEEQEHIFNTSPTSCITNTIGQDIKVSFLYKIVGGYKKTIQGISILEDSDQNKYIWTADSSGLVKITNSSTYAPEKEFDTNLGRIHTMTSVRDHAWIASSQSVSVWDRSGTLVKEFPGLYASITAVYSHGECRIWAGTDQKISIFSSSSLELVQEIEIPAQFIVSITEIFGDSNQVWVGGLNGSIYIFDKTTGAEIKKISTPARRNITCLTFHKYMDKGNVWAGSEDKQIFVIDPIDYTIIKTISDGEMLLINSLKSISNTVWSCSRDHTIRIWDSKSFQLIGQLEDYHTDAVTDAVLIYNSRKLRWELWSASYDKSLCIWGVYSDYLVAPPTF